PAATGSFLFDENMQEVESSGRYLGESTNNVAEYEALIEGLQMALRNEITELECRLDSELVVKQVNGEYKVKNERMQGLHAQVSALVKSFPAVRFAHVPRAENKLADAKVNEILDMERRGAT